MPRVLTCCCAAAVPAGVNDSQADAARLLELTRAMYCMVNLIVFNPHEGTQFQRSADDDVRAFRRVLVDGGKVGTRGVLTPRSAALAGMTACAVHSRAGQGRAGQGRAGQGRAGQGRARLWSSWPQRAAAWTVTGGWPFGQSCAWC